MQKIIVSFIFLFLTSCLAPGPLDVDLYWQKVSTGEFTWCANAGVELMSFVIYDVSDKNDRLEEFISCANSLHFDSEQQGGKYVLKVKGYYYEGFYKDNNLVMGWSKTCDNLVVNGRNTKRYSCDIPVTDKEERLDEYETSGRTARMATSLLEDR